MNRLTLLLSFIAIVLLSGACGDKKKKSYDEIGESGLTTRTENLQANLRTFANKGTIVGQQYGTLEGIGWKADTVEQSDIRSICNDGPACSGYELAGLERGQKVNTDSVAFSDIRTDVLRLFHRGGLVLMAWSAPDYKGDEKVLDTWLGHIATYLESLQDEYGIKAPVVLFLYPLRQDTWYAKLSPEDYKTLYGHSLNKLRDLGVTNAIFGMSYSDDMPVSQVEASMPEGIDVLQVSVLRPGKTSVTTAAYRSALDSGVQHLMRLSRERNLAAGLNAGLEGLPTTDCFMGALQPLLRSQRLAYLLMGPNRGDIDGGHYYVPFPGLDNERINDFVDFYNDESTVLIGTLNGLYLRK